MNQAKNRLWSVSFFKFSRFSYIAFMRYVIMLFSLICCKQGFAQIPNGYSINFAIATQNSTLIRNYEGESATSNSSNQTYEFSVGSRMYNQGRMLGVNLNYAGTLNESTGGSKSKTNSFGFNLPVGKNFSFNKDFGYSFEINPGYTYRLTNAEFSGLSSKVSTHELAAFAGFGFWWMPVSRLGLELKYNLISFRHAWTGSIEEASTLGNSVHERKTSFSIYSPGNIQPGAFVLSAFYLFRK